MRVEEDIDSVGFWNILAKLPSEAPKLGKFGNDDDAEAKGDGELVKVELEDEVEV